MIKLNVRNGTSAADEHLCRNCNHGQFTVGYRESDVLVICTNPSPAMQVPFPVRECSDFSDRNRPDWSQMQQLAVNFSEARRKPVPGFRGSGFSLAPARVEDDGEDGEEAARGR